LTKEDILARLKDIVKAYIPEEVEFDQLDEDTDFLEDLQINSAHLIDIILDIEDEFDIEISDEEAEEMINVQKTVEVIEGKI
jgi:acyl carrier protein